MGKLRHEEVKADISKHEMLQALFSVIPRHCRSWWWPGGIRGPQCSPKLGLGASKPGSQIHSQEGTLGQNVLLRSPGRAEPLGTHLWALMELNPWQVLQKLKAFQGNSVRVNEVCLCLGIMSNVAGAFIHQQR